MGPSTGFSKVLLCLPAREVLAGQERHQLFVTNHDPIERCKT